MATFAIAWFVVILVMPATVFAQSTKAPRRLAVVHLSDGEVLHGKVLLTPGIDFSIAAVPELGKKFGQVRTFNVDIVKEMSFFPYTLNKKAEPERMVVPFKFDTKDRTIKIPTGDPYPIRELACTAKLTNDQELTGVLRSVTFYVQVLDPDTGFVVKNRRFILKSKQTGKPGEHLRDLVYVTRIRMLDEGTNIASKLDLELKQCKLGKDDELAAITRRSLEHVPVKATAKPGIFEVSSTFGEGVYVGARQGNKYLAGWPTEGTEPSPLFTEFQKHLAEIRDFYDERKLIGILPNENGTRVLTLVSLRRHVPKNAYKGTANGEFDKDGKPMEFFRLSIWLWKRDPAAKKVILSERGSFFRVRIEAGGPTPIAEASRELWPAELLKDKAKIVVGK